MCLYESRQQVCDLPLTCNAYTMHQGSLLFLLAQHFRVFIGVAPKKAAWALTGLNES